MRLRFPIGFSVFVLLVGIDAAAAIHITDIDGREVTVYRGPAGATVQATVQAKVQAKTRRLITHAIVNAGPDTDAANNDYRRIQDAIDAAGPGTVITLNGTFDFTQPFAAAAWALGDDNTAATADDYSVYVPANKNGVTLTATSLGSATIQGPGDLAAVNLEGFLVFDGGDNQNWTISNLRILDFDLGIGFFDGAGGADAFNGTIIQNNFIRIPTDLNATVAPADVNQNIGLHFSFGTNESILNNSFQVPGDGLSDTGGGNFSSSVVMQSSTSGGSVYNGLTISGNTTHVLNAQSADPEVLLGIWDNGHAHTSNITISNNSFINDAAGNNASLTSSAATASPRTPGRPRSSPTPATA